MSQAPEGIHQDQVTEWMVAHIAEISPPLTFTLIAGGRSNLTFRVEDAAGGPGRCAVRPCTTCCPPRTTWRASTGS